MEGVKSRGAIIISDLIELIRLIGKFSTQLPECRGAVVINRQSEKRLLLEIKCGFGLTRRGLLKVVHLPTSDQRRGVKVTHFGQGDVVVGFGIKAVLGGIEVLHEIAVTQFGHVKGDVGLVGEIHLTLIPDTVTARGGRFRKFAGATRFLARILIIDIVRDELAVASVVLAEFEIGVESHRIPAEGAVVLADRGQKIVAGSKRKRVGRQQVPTPVGIVSGGNLKTLAAEIPESVGQPENGDFTNIKSRIEHHDAVAGVETDRPGVNMPVWHRGIGCGDVRFPERELPGSKALRRQRTEFQRSMTAVELQCADLLGLQIVESPLSAE